VEVPSSLDCLLPGSPRPGRWRSRPTADRWPWGGSSRRSGYGTFPACRGRSLWTAKGPTVAVCDRLRLSMQIAHC
jgi:hypothetical protein